MTDIAKVKGIGPATAKIMAEDGVLTVEDIIAGGVEKLLEISGFSSTRAARILGEAKTLLAAEMSTTQKVEKIAKVKESQGGKIKKKTKKTGKKKAEKKISKTKKKKRAAKEEKSKKKKNKKSKKSTGKKVKKG